MSSGRVLHNFVHGNWARRGERGNVVHTARCAHRSSFLRPYVMFASNDRGFYFRRRSTKVLDNDIKSVLRKKRKKKKIEFFQNNVRLLGRRLLHSETSYRRRDGAAHCTRLARTERHYAPRDGQTRLRTADRTSRLPHQSVSGDCRCDFARGPGAVAGRGQRPDDIGIIYIYL